MIEVKNITEMRDREVWYAPNPISLNPYPKKVKVINIIYDEPIRLMLSDGEERIASYCHKRNKWKRFNDLFPTELDALDFSMSFLIKRLDGKPSKYFPQFESQLKGFERKRNILLLQNKI